MKQSHETKKRWIAGEDPAIQEKLNQIAAEAVFQLEVGGKHYQGRFKLLTRKSKKVLLKDFSEIFET